MDLTVLPTLFALAVFVSCFRPLVRRVGPHTNIWFLGWTFLLLHYIALFLPESQGLQHQVRSLVAIWAVELCGMCFIWAAGNPLLARSNQVLTLEVGLPIILQSGLYVFDVESHAVRLTATMLLLVPAVHLLFLPAHRTKIFNRLAIGFALLSVGLVLFSRADPLIVLSIMNCALFLSAAYLTFENAARVTRGNGVMLAGLCLWGLSYPLQTISTVKMHLSVNQQIFNFPQYILAAGMILWLLDEYLDRTENLALHDPLTGLPNRRLFEHRLDEAIAESALTKTPIACLVIDVDNFKFINDTMGHPVGDGLLQALAKRLSWNLGPRDMLARTGGDEFTAVLVEAADEYHVRFIAGAMMAAGCVPVSIQQYAIDVRISIGIAVSPQDASDAGELHKAADDAMYRAKRRGGSVVAFAHEELAGKIHAM